MNLTIEKNIAKFLVAVTLSLICFGIINNFIAHVNILEYLFIECLLITSHYFYKFVHRKISDFER